MRNKDLEVFETQGLIPLIEMGKSGEETHFHFDKAIYYGIILKVMAQYLLVVRKQCILTWSVLLSHVLNRLVSSV